MDKGKSLMIGGTGSGCGKTTVTAAVLGGSDCPKNETGAL